MNQPSITSNQSSNDQQLTTTLVAQLHTALAAIDGLQAQVMQMKDMFDDDDGMICGALKDAEQATASAYELLTQFNRTKSA